MVGFSNTPPSFFMSSTSENKIREKKMNNFCSIDWLSITTPHGRGQNFPAILAKSYIVKNGRMGYEQAYVYESGITHLWSENRPEHHIIYSGKTLRNISEIMTIQQLVQFHQDLGHRTSRIDTAIDLFDTGATVSSFADDWKNSRVVTHARAGLFISDPRGESGDTFYLGSLKRRRKLLRVYDKAKEQKVDKDWIRLEMQYGQGAARSCSKQVASSDSLETTIIEQLHDFVRFQVSVYRNLTKNRSTLKVSHQMPQGVSNRKHWINTCVVPALVSLEMEEPGYLKTLLNYVEGLTALKRKEIKTV